MRWRWPMEWRSDRRQLRPAHRTGLPAAMGAGAGLPCAAVSRRHGQVESQCRRDPRALRRRAAVDDHRRRPREGFFGHRPARRCGGLPRHRCQTALGRRSGGGVMMKAGPPLWLLAELTYRCPLHCVFCYNPTDFARQEDELGTEDWLRVLREGRALGAVQCGLSGGEPLLRDDLEIIVAEAARLGYYTNLLTSGVGLTAQRAAALKAAGLDHVQLSFQDSTREMNDFLSHTKTFELKNRVAKIIKDQGWPMVMNVVIHRMNIDHIDRIIEMAHEMGAEYLELANTQYYSWAFVNRDQLLPTHEQLRRAEEVTDGWRARLGERMRIFYVAPDYHEGRAKKCVNGWGSMFLTVAPDGTAL